jgi:hypothetical protein
LVDARVQGPVRIIEIYRPVVALLSSRPGSRLSVESSCNLLEAQSEF